MKSKEKKKKGKERKQKKRKDKQKIPQKTKQKTRILHRLTQEDSNSKSAWAVVLQPTLKGKKGKKKI